MIDPDSDSIFDKLFFMGPMALGDNFVLSGMVHYYADKCDELHLPVKPEHIETMTTLYQDYPNIRVVPLLPYDLGENQYVEEHKLSRVRRARLIHSRIKNFELTPMWDLQLYSMHDLQFDLRYTNFRLPKHIDGSEELYQRLTGGEPYFIVHRYTGDHPSGIPLNIGALRADNNLPDIKCVEITPDITSNMMHYVKLIQNAQEIHCVPSSFYCLVDSIIIEKKLRLYYHDIREKAVGLINSKWNRHKWHHVLYPEKI
jgi:hypothetical protein